MDQPLRAVSLDLDNTLWDTPPVLARAEAVLREWLVANSPGIASRWRASPSTGRQAKNWSRPSSPWYTWPPARPYSRSSLSGIITVVFFASSPMPGA